MEKRNLEGTLDDILRLCYPICSMREKYKILTVSMVRYFENDYVTDKDLSYSNIGCVIRMMLAKIEQHVELDSMSANELVIHMKSTYSDYHYRNMFGIRNYRAIADAFGSMKIVEDYSFITEFEKENDLTCLSF